MARRKTTGLQISRHTVTAASVHDNCIDPAFAKLKSDLTVEAWKNTPNGRKTCRLIKQQEIECSRVAMQALIQRHPANEPIDVERLVNDSMAIGKSMVCGFAEKKWF